MWGCTSCRFGSWSSPRARYAAAVNLILLFASLVFAASTWSIESGLQRDRAAADGVKVSAEKLGYSARVVRRFRLGEGWGWVTIVDGLDGESAATAAATRLAAGSALTFTVVQDSAKTTSKKPPTPPTPAPTAAVPTAADWVARTLAAHGGDSAGSVLLSRAVAVHFSFERRVERGSAPSLVVNHDYWREGANRKIVVSPDPTGAKSIAVATASSAWIGASGRVEARDIGVIVNQADTFAPETVLSVALDVPSLLAAPEGLVFLEGAEGAVRIGRGEDPTEPGLAYFDADPQTAQLISVRYVTQGGPIEFRYEGWTLTTGGVLYPTTLQLTRPDGGMEQVRVKTLVVADAFPAGTFDTPTAP